MNACYILLLLLHVSETRDRCGLPCTLKIRKICLLQGFGFFIESIPAIIARHPPGTSGKEWMRVLQAPLWLHQNNFESKQILFHKHLASKWQSRAAASTSQPGNWSRGAKRGRKESKKTAALRGETPRSWVGRVSWKILTGTAEQQWNNSLMEMRPLPASSGTPAGT